MPDRSFTPEEWSAFPKDNFTKFIMRWNIRKGYMEKLVEGGQYRKEIPTRLPYRISDDRTAVLVDEDFLSLLSSKI